MPLYYRRPAIALPYNAMLHKSPTAVTGSDVVRKFCVKISVNVRKLFFKVRQVLECLLRLDLFLYCHFVKFLMICLSRHQCVETFAVLKQSEPNLQGNS